MQDLVERGECECSWIGFNIDSEKENDYQTAAWGYIYSYATGIDGIAFKDGLIGIPICRCMKQMIVI